MLTMKRSLLLWSIPVLVSLQSGCHNTITLTASPDEPGKVVVFAQRDDIIQWKGVTPSFLGPAPCTVSNGKCSVAVDDGSYLYGCNGCTDPEVVVGPNSELSGQGGQGPKPTVAPGAIPEYVSLWCNNNQVSLTPNPLPVTATAGTSIQVIWVLTGTGNQKITTATVTPSGASPVPCQIGNPPYSCTFNAPNPGTAYTYSAVSVAGACVGAAAANGTIQF